MDEFNSFKSKGLYADFVTELRSTLESIVFAHGHRHGWGRGMQEGWVLTA